jgi:hypothetical protein
VDLIVEMDSFSWRKDKARNGRIGEDEEDTEMNEKVRHMGQT